MTCDIFGTWQTNISALCSVYAEKRDQKLLEKLLTWAAHKFHRRLWWFPWNVWNWEVQYKWTSVQTQSLIGSLSSDVFEPRTSTGSEVFYLLTCLDDIKFVFLSCFTVIEAIWLKICAKPPSKNEKRPLPVDVHRSKTLLLKLPNGKWSGSKT